MTAPQKLWKMFFISPFYCRDNQICVFPSFTLFLPVSHCSGGWSKINLKLYDVINCLNKNLILHLAWCLGKEKRYDIKTLPIDGVLNKEHFYGKTMQKNVLQKLVPDPILLLVNILIQPLHERNYFKNKIFWERMTKKR